VAFWTIIVEFIAGVVAKFLMSGDYEPSGFILTALLGIVCRHLPRAIARLVQPGRGCRTVGGYRRHRHSKRPDCRTTEDG
jgi:uncharacterized membrane protein YeaQ/YmgE (transglycosylase-associated protein family)